MSTCWLQGKTVVVTGASGGMGAGIAATLIKKHGCTVIGVARNEKKMLHFIEELGETYAKQFSYELFDVSVKENWENLTKKALRLMFSLTTQVFFQNSRDLTNILMTKSKEQ